MLCSPGRGPSGIRQVNVRGLVATAFTHRDSRAGDPDLHTHVAVANKVQTFGGRWLSIDGRVLFKATVAASETYNTALEHHLRDRLGCGSRIGLTLIRGKLPVREIVGVDPALNQRWSTRQDVDQGPAGCSWRGSFSVIMVGRRRRWRRCSWRSRPPWRPGRPSTNPAGWPSSAPPGMPRPPKRSADLDAVQTMISAALNPDLGAEPGRGCGVGGSDRGEGAGGGGGAAFDLAELACPRRSATPRPGRAGSHRQGRAAG